MSQIFWLGRKVLENGNYKMGRGKFEYTIFLENNLITNDKGYILA